MKCIDCKKRTKQFLVKSGVEKRFLFFKWKGDRNIPLCRDHLIKYFKEAFLNAKQRMIVFCPNLEGKKGVYQYFYSTRETIEKYAPDPKINDSILSQMDKWIETITGKCANCSSDTGVAYFNSYSISYERVPGYLGGLFDYPMIHKVSDKPKILCRLCAFKEIEFAFRASNEGFREGVFTPKEGKEGIYVAVEI
jgi:hypothetical protein